MACWSYRLEIIDDDISEKCSETGGNCYCQGDEMACLVDPNSTSK